MGVLELTFKNEGDTPQNKYEIYVDHADHLVKQWAYIAEAGQSDPPRIWPWDNYKTYGNLKLSSDRSDGNGPSNVRIYKSLNHKVFESFDQVDYY